MGWNKDIHIVGHSMGGMIATRLAALAPERLASLTLISVTSGGFQIIPRSWRALKYALQVCLFRHHYFHFDLQCADVLCEICTHLRMAVSLGIERQARSSLDKRLF